MDGTVEDDDGSDDDEEVVGVEVVGTPPEDTCSNLTSSCICDVCDIICTVDVAVAVDVAIDIDLFVLLNNC